MPDMPVSQTQDESVGTAYEPLRGIEQNLSKHQEYIMPIKLDNGRAITDWSGSFGNDEPNK
jgi:hypothetical protein